MVAVPMGGARSRGVAYVCAAPGVCGREQRATGTWNAAIDLDRFMLHMQKQNIRVTPASNGGLVAWLKCATIDIGMLNPERI